MSVSDPKPAAPRVLVVDDSRNMTLALSIGLARSGFQVTVATDGRSALDELQRSRFDAVVTDVQLPALSGVQVAQAAEERFPGIRLVVMSAFEKPDGLGRVAYLAKPFSLEDLLPLLPDPPLPAATAAGRRES